MTVYLSHPSLRPGNHSIEFLILRMLSSIMLQIEYKLDSSTRRDRLER